MKRYNALDGVRAIAMIGVLVMHVLANVSYRDNLSTLYSYIMYFRRFTSLFMMVSAFSVSCGYYTKIQKGGGEIEKFYKKRYRKILPFFAFLTVLDIALGFSKESIFEGFANITLVFGLIPHESITVIGVGWTLGVIFVFYMLYPFIVFLMNSKPRFCLAFICSLIYAFVVNGYFGLERVDFVYCACYFLGGCLIFLYKDEIEAKCNRQIMTVVVAALTVLYYVCVFNFEILINYVQFLLFAAIIMLSITISDRKSILSNKIMRFFSGISLEIYLCHMVIYRIVEKMGWVHFFSNDLLSYIFACCATLVGAMLLSLAFKKAEEIRKMWFIKME